MRRGEIVLVRAFGGKPLKRRVWDVGVSVVYITNDEHYDRLLAGEHTVQAIGFPKEDVFQVTKDEHWEDSIDWSRLVPWTAIQLSMFPRENDWVIQNQQLPKVSRTGHFSGSIRRKTKVRDSKTAELGLLPGMSAATL
jgi:hypothetical protein